MSERYVKIVFKDHAYYNEIDLDKNESKLLSGITTVAIGKVIDENDERFLIAPWIAEGANSDVYAILKSNIIHLEELIPKSYVKKMKKSRR